MHFMTSSMVSSVGTAKPRKAIRRRCERSEAISLLGRIHLILLWTLLVSGVSQAGPTCADRAKGLQDLSLLDFDLSSSLAKWSTDYLLKLVLDVEQNYLQHCPDGPRESSILRVKQAYLERLGVRLNRISPREQGILFRGLITIEERSAPLKRSVVKQPSPRTALPHLKSIFKSASLLRGVVVLGGSKKERAQLEAFIADVCGSAAECRFWNPLSLYKVVLTDEGSIAGYIGETAELVLSG